MALLMTTFGFLLIFSFYAITQFYHLVNFQLTHELYEEQVHTIQESTNTALKKRADHNYYALAKRFDTNLEPPEDEETDDPRLPPLPTIRLSRKMHLSLLISNDPAQTKGAQYAANVQLLKNLISALYSNAPFYQEALEKDHNFLDRFVHDVLEKAHKEKIKLPEHLANLHMDDEEMQNCLFKILSGKTDSEKKEAESHGAQSSLLEFISFQHKAQCVSAYLAPRPILFAIFQDENTVDEIMRERDEIHGQLRSPKGNAIELAEQFKNRFQDRLSAGIEPQMIDFRVSKTKP